MGIERGPGRTFGGFLNHEMRSRGLSARQFAAYCGVSHGFMARHLNHGYTDNYGGKAVGDPDLHSLIKIAIATNTNICALIRLVRPDAPMPASEAEFPTEIVRLAQRVSQLSPLQRLRAEELLVEMFKTSQKRGE